MTAWKRLGLVSVHRQKSLEYSRHYRGTLIPPSSCFHVEGPPLEQHCWFPLPPSLTCLWKKKVLLDWWVTAIGMSPSPHWVKLFKEKLVIAGDLLSLLLSQISWPSWVRALCLLCRWKVSSIWSPQCLHWGGLWVVASKVSASTFS